jgi:hypothetical protein
VTTAAALAAAVGALDCGAVPGEPTVAKLPEASQAAGEAAEGCAPDREAITREDCKRAAREGKWVGLATPAAWAAALERDEERHACALGLLKRETWGLYERQRLQDRDIAELWRAVTRLAEALRRATRGDTKQEALFGLLVESEGLTDAT